MRALAAAFATLVAIGPAFAAGYDDFTRGVTAEFRGESDTAIRLLSEVLGAADIPPAYIATAYQARALAFLQKDMCNEAMSDLAKYTGLKGESDRVAALRIRIHLCRKDFKSAEKEFVALAGTEPTVSSNWEFAKVLWDFGMFAEEADYALRVVKAVNKKSPMLAYDLLWVAIGQVRADRFDRAVFADLVTGAQLEDWPKPILDFYLGKLTEEKVFDAAKSWSQSKELGQTCEVDFYVAEYHLSQQNRDAAIPMLRDVVARCPATFIEYRGAQAELKRLGVKE